jgi:ABC-type nitrate/sulfonate/bicarbonate transport system substrate-binding protein
MKHIVRAFVVVLALTGAAASTQVSYASSQDKVTARVSCLPIPSCAPNDPNACGMAQGR